jgi:C-terminal processing protease CtpA/Prc
MRRLFYASALFTCSQMAFSQTEQQVQNQIAFTRLFGYVRYFHPSDEAAQINWDRFAVYGSSVVDKCKTPQELQKALNDLFTPVAPSVKVFETKEKLQFNVDDITPPKEHKYKPIVWQHLGVGLGSGGDKYNPYMSARTNRPMLVRSAGNGFGTFTLHLNDAKKYAGQEFIYTAKVKLNNGPGAGAGHLWFRVDKGKALGFFDNMDDRPIKNKTWAEYSIKGKVDESLSAIYFGVFLTGAGQLLVDSIELKMKDARGWHSVFACNFQKDTLYKYPESMSENLSKVQSPGYEMKVLEDIRMHRILSIKNEEISDTAFTKVTHHLRFPKLPHFGEYINKEIGSGLSCIVPIVLYGDDDNTFPKADSAKLDALKKNIRAVPDSSLTGNNLYCRLGDAAICWNIFQHFFVYFDIAKTNWYEDLNTVLRRAYTDKTEMEFQGTLQKLTAKLKDGHIYVHGEFAQPDYMLPITWEWVENKLVITGVFSDSLSLQKGDVVTSINGTAPADYFKTAEENISAASKGWMESRADFQTLMGYKTSESKLAVTDAKGKSKTVTVRNSMSPAEHYDKSTASEKVRKIGSDIYYINLDGVADSTLDSLMPALANCKSLIFDLRGYPSVNQELIKHLMTKNDTSDAWMRIPRIIYPDHDSVYEYDKEGWAMKPVEPHLNAKIFFLTDGSAISYAESFMSFIEHYKLATIIGQPTAGTNGNINPFALPGGYNISWTGMKVVKHDGSQHHGVGILPNVTVNKTIKGVREGRDEFLDKAIELAKQ